MTNISAADRAAAVERLKAVGDDLSSKQLLDRAVSLLDGGSDDGRDQAAGIICDLLALQVLDEADRVGGQFPMRPGRGTGDLNACLFLLPAMLDILERHGDRLPAGMLPRLEGAIQRAVVATQRRWDEEVFDIHRDHKGYTNIFLLYTQALLLAGLHYSDARLLRVADGQWQRWFNHVAHYGMDEFVSTYYNVDYEALRRIHARATDERMRRQARLILDYLVTQSCAVTHPLLEMAACGSSRDYRRFLTTPHYELACVTDAGDEDYRPPEAVKSVYQARKFPYAAAARATGAPFLFQSWQLERAALGSMTGGNYFWQQIHCIAMAGESAERREVVFLPGSYSIAGGYVQQRQGRALCVFARVPNSYLRTQKLRPDEEIADTFGDLGVGMTEGWSITCGDAGRLALTAYGHAVTIDPFILTEGHLEPAALSPARRANLSQNGRFHDTPVDMQEWLFPAEPRWLGCLVQLTEEGRPAPRPELSCRQTGDQIEITEADGLCVRLFLNPTGGVTELYERDWRTLPLLACPEQTLWPGELAACGLEKV
jgi:hypothetical protein